MPANNKMSNSKNSTNSTQCTKHPNGHPLTRAFGWAAAETLVAGVNRRIVPRSRANMVFLCFVLLYFFVVFFRRAFVLYGVLLVLALYKSVL